ncbi:MAG: HD domain-containing protein [Actinomycetes bacterium]
MSVGPRNVAAVFIHESAAASRRELAVLWGKSAGGWPCPLLAHLLGTAVWAGALWDRNPSSPVRVTLESGPGGDGGAALRSTSAAHDDGEADPLFLSPASLMEPPVRQWYGAGSGSLWVRLG